MNEIASVRDLRRSQIIAAARNVVAESGLEALTFGAIESRVNFSRGVITYHFANKDEIIEAVLDSALTEIDSATRAEVEASLSADQKVRAMLETTLHGFLEHPEAAHILLCFWGRIPANPHTTELNAKLYATYRAHATELIADVHDSAEDSDVSVDAMAGMFVALVIGIATQVFFEPGAIDPAAVMDEACKAILARLGAAA